MKRRVPSSVLLISLCLSAGVVSCGHQPESGDMAPPSILSGEKSGAPPSASAGQQAVTPANLMRVAEVDARLLNEKKQQRLLALAKAQPCPCPDSHQQLAACALAKGTCARARFAVRSIARGLDDDADDEEIHEHLVERFGPRDPESIDISKAPCRGPESAPVTMVLFSDFECPYCAMGARLCKKLLERVPDRLRICFMNFPLTTIHKEAYRAALAAVAAGLQNKFWPMHDLLYADQETLDRGGLLERARQLDLDLERFKKDLDSPQTAQLVEHDLSEAKRLGLNGTPTFFINGREMTDPKTPEVFLDWIAEALAQQKEKSAPPTE